MGSVLRELEELRTLLDQSPSKIYHPFTTLSLSTNVSTPKATKPGYAAALSTAEVGINVRLNGGLRCVPCMLACTAWACTTWECTAWICDESWLSFSIYL